MNKISVAMTTYNGEKYIEKQLLSMINQRRKVDEVIIHDDCSTDKTVEIISKFIKSHKLSGWKVIVNSENLGFVKNFYKSISETTGNIIFLSDQDDIWDDNKVSEIERIFDENEDALAVNTSFRFIDSNDNEIFSTEKKNTCNNRLIFRKLPRNSINKISELEVLRSNISPGCTIAFTDSLKDYYIDHASFIIPHDLEINIYAARLGGLYFYNKCLMKYRIHNMNTIGLQVMNSSSILSQVKRVLKNRKNAMKILDGQLKLAKFFGTHYITPDAKANKYMKKFIKYVRLREKELVKGHFLGWFRSWLYYPYLRPNISAIKIVEDLVYAMRLDKLFLKMFDKKSSKFKIM